MKGGYRQGAGRKKGFSAIKAEEARKILSSKVLLEIEPIADILIKKAKEGDIRAIKELLDRAWGRPQQQSTGINDELEQLPVPIGGLSLTEENLQKYKFTSEERVILEKRLDTKTN